VPFAISLPSAQKIRPIIKKISGIWGESKPNRRVFTHVWNAYIRQMSLVRVGLNFLSVPPRLEVEKAAGSTGPATTLLKIMLDPRTDS
jgi:hypothetical protein